MVFSCHRERTTDTDLDVLLWKTGVLQSELSAKHRETFWVKAHTTVHGTQEHFHYTAVEHTKGPLLSNLPLLLSTGLVELDYTLSEKINAKGDRRIRDHGYLFKMWARDRVALFPPPRLYDLTSA
jgi:hypothetical protein